MMLVLSLFSSVSLSILLQLIEKMVPVLMLLLGSMHSLMLGFIIHLHAPIFVLHCPGTKTYQQNKQRAYDECIQEVESVCFLVIHRYEILPII